MDSAVAWNPVGVHVVRPIAVAVVVVVVGFNEAFVHRSAVLLTVAFGVHAIRILLQHVLAFRSRIGVLAVVRKFDLVVVSLISYALSFVCNRVIILVGTILEGLNLDVGRNENRVCVESRIDKIVD